MKRLLSTAVALLWLTAAAPLAYAGGSGIPRKCRQLNVTSCTSSDGVHWTVQHGSGLGGGSGGGIPGWFVAIFILVLLLGIGGTVWRLSLAQRMARRAGLNEGEATAVTLLTPGGLDAAYLASALHDKPADGAPAAPADHRPVEDRLRELQQLKDKGLITAAEYEQRRSEVLADI